MSAILKIRSEIESRKCFAIKTTILHYKVTIFTNRTSLTMNNFTMTSVLTSNMRHGLYKLYLDLCHLRVVYFPRVEEKHDLHRNYSYHWNFYVTRTCIVWLGSLTVTCQTCNPEVTQGRRFDFALGHCRVTTRQVVYTHVPLLPNSIIW